MTPVNYHEAAENELLNEIGYLEQRGKGLGRRFFAEISRASHRAVSGIGSGDSTWYPEAHTPEVSVLAHLRN